MAGPNPQDDNILGICAAIGEDCGFDPLYLRLLLAAGVLWRPEIMLGTYLAMGVIVLAVRWLMPDRRQGVVAAE